MDINKEDTEEIIDLSGRLVPKDNKLKVIPVMTVVYTAPNPDNSGARFARLDKDHSRIIKAAAQLTEKICRERAGILAVGVTQMLESEYEKINKKE